MDEIPPLKSFNFLQFSSISFKFLLLHYRWRASPSHCCWTWQGWNQDRDWIFHGWGWQEVQGQTTGFFPFGADFSIPCHSCCFSCCCCSCWLAIIFLCRLWGRSRWRRLPRLLTMLSPEERFFPLFFCGPFCKRISPQFFFFFFFMEIAPQEVWRCCWSWSWTQFLDYQHRRGRPFQAQPESIGTFSLCIPSFFPFPFTHSWGGSCSWRRRSPMPWAQWRSPRCSSAVFAKETTSPSSVLTRIPLVLFQTSVSMRPRRLRTPRKLPVQTRVVLQNMCPPACAAEARGRENPCPVTRVLPPALVREGCPA